MMGAKNIARKYEDYILSQVLIFAIIIINGTVSGIIRAEGTAKRSMVIPLVARLSIWF